MDYAVGHPTGRVLLVIPPRGGKTFVGAYLMYHMVVAHGLQGLWLAHREELLDQAVEHLVEAGIHPASIGVIKHGRPENPSARIQVASDHTLIRRKVLPPAHLVITDEAHRDTAAQRRRLRKAYPKAFLLGLTATPKPPPQRELSEDYDTMMVVVQPSELIHDKYLSVPSIYIPEKSQVPKLRGVRITNGDYNVADLERLVLQGNYLDDQVREWARLSGGRRTLAYPVSVNHSMALVDRFRAAGVDAVHIDSNMRGKERIQIIESARCGRIPVLSSVDVFSEGTNLPIMKCVLGVRSTLSLRVFIQQYLRASTPYNDVDPIVLDAVGNCYIHGSPFADRRWSLKNSESGHFIAEGLGVLKRCAACGLMNAGGNKVCEKCQKTFEVPSPSIPTDPLHLQRFQPENKQIDTEKAQLIEYAREKGFRHPEQWADQIILAKYRTAA